MREGREMTVDNIWERDCGCVGGGWEIKEQMHLRRETGKKKVKRKRLLAYCYPHDGKFDTRSKST